MIQSMTAFAREEAQGDWGSVVWELRALNARYLDLSVRMPEEFRALEAEVRATVGKSLQRGKVECSLRFRPVPGQEGGLDVDLELARELARISREIDGLLYDPARINAMEIMRWPGVVASRAPDPEVVHKAVRDTLAAGLIDLCKARAREGEKIEQMIRTRCREILAIVSQVRESYPQLIAELRSRLEEKLAGLTAELDAGRVEQEVVLLTHKADVAEELDRLQAHVVEVERMLGQNKPVGRRLDFFMQELNREANTLGSKSCDLKMTQAAVDLKVLIEQMREQIQNIE